VCVCACLSVLRVCVCDESVRGAAQRTQALVQRFISILPVTTRPQCDLIGRWWVPLAAVDLCSLDVKKRAAEGKTRRSAAAKTKRQHCEPHQQTLGRQPQPGPQCLIDKPNTRSSFGNIMPQAQWVCNHRRRAIQEGRRAENHVRGQKRGRTRAPPSFADELAAEGCGEEAGQSARAWRDLSRWRAPRACTDVRVASNERAAKTSRSRTTSASGNLLDSVS
jgi:hypothetical protein